MSVPTILVVRDPDPTVVVVREPTVVVVSGVGAQGPQGDPGAVGSADASDITFDPVGNIAATDVQAAIAEVAAEAGLGSYTHNQVTPAAVWGPIAHNRGYIPNVYVVESTGDDLQPGRSDPDLNTTTLDFDGVAVSGSAHFS